MELLITATSEKVAEKLDALGLPVVASGPRKGPDGGEGFAWDVDTSSLADIGCDLFTVFRYRTGILAGGCAENPPSMAGWIAFLDAVEPGWRNPTTDSTDTSSSKGSDREDVELVIALAEPLDRFHDTRKTPFIGMPLGASAIAVEVHSEAARQWLMREYYRRYGRPPRGAALSDALQVLAAQALYDGEEEEVHLRVAGLDDRVYVDLGDDTGRAIEIDRRGWRVVEHPPVRFRRSGAMKGLPDPVSGGVDGAGLARLRQHIRCSDSDFVLLLAWLVQALLPTAPYPILSLAGEQGTGKSTTTRFVRSLVDPWPCPSGRRRRTSAIS